MIGLIGINHKTASVDERAAFALSPAEATMLINDWRSAGYVEGAIVLSTCNRVEIYYESSATCPRATRRLVESLLDNLEVSPRLRRKVIGLRGEALLRHLFGLTSGLESMVLGETQILGQVKDAFRHATAHGQSTPLLSRMFHKAFEAAKRIRSQYIVSATPLSAGSAAVDLLYREHPDRLSLPALVVGAGQMAETIIKHLQHLGVGQIGIYNRTRERVERFAERHPGLELYAESELPRALRASRVIFVATSASSPVVLATHLEGRQEELWVFDLAVPRNVEERVADLADVHLYSIDDLHSQSRAEHTETLLQEARAILEEVLADFVQWSEEAGMRRVIGQIQQVSDLILVRELEQLPQQLSPQERRLIEQYDTHLRTSYATALASSLRELTEQQQNPKHIEALGALFTHILEKAKR